MCRDRINELQRAGYSRNRTKALSRCRSYYSKNREAVLARMRAYYQNVRKARWCGVAPAITTSSASAEGSL